ncbi:hypothetical protein J6590_033590 [Homalodisca vitripennis]|nr:hypothetical protein J6590_033590 [Homalodisca vitripennis]
MYQRAVKQAYHLCQYAFADVATVPVAMATASDAPRSYWSSSQPGKRPSTPIRKLYLFDYSLYEACWVRRFPCFGMTISMDSYKLSGNVLQSL